MANWFIRWIDYGESAYGKKACGKTSYSQRHDIHPSVISNSILSFKARELKFCIQSPQTDANQSIKGIFNILFWGWLMGVFQARDVRKENMPLPFISLHTLVHNMAAALEAMVAFFSTRCYHIVAHGGLTWRNCICNIQDFHAEFLLSNNVLFIKLMKFRSHTRTLSENRYVGHL